ADPLLLVVAAEVEAAHVGAAGDLDVADFQDILAARHFFPDGFLAVHAVAELVHGGHLHGFTQADGARIRLLAALDHAEQGGLTGAVGAYDDNYGTLGYAEAQVVNQHPVAVALLEVADFQHLVPQAPAGGNKK